MKRIQSSTAVTTPPAVPALSGNLGYFTEGDPAGGIPATNVPAWWMNGVQDELVGLIEAAGLFPLASNTAQVLAALRLMFGARLSVFLTSGAAVVPDGKTQGLVLLWAPGGGGGGSLGTGSAGSAGGAGECRVGIVNGLTPGQSIPVTVPGGGSGGAGTPSNGGAGGNASFGAYLTAIGGGAGLAGNNTIQTGGAGAGGTGGSGGQLVIAGRVGGLGINYGGVPGGGVGGSAFMASTPGPSVNGAGAGGVFPGGGGNGGAGGFSGGAGANGLCLVLWI
ncbi:glycine-rich domain-containing protein [Teichococcus aestuarii]|uniref:glycine-rich domain-containing protein n=1 Tax=Teichococcus aestuarii TaxID=568898 RepID=UPI0036113B79